MQYAWFDKGDGRQVYRRVHAAPVAKSSLPSPMIAGDAMEPTEHPHDGVLYESKSAFRRVTRANGYVEMGNDPARLRMKPKPQPDRKAIKDSIQRAFAKLRA